MQPSRSSTKPESECRSTSQAGVTVPPVQVASHDQSISAGLTPSGFFLGLFLYVGPLR